ncbi:MAG: dihydrofolate reductase [Paludibacteraceae bacterium]|nr:dihydrofolate reductase [Paludibacteraceae bacterium]MBR6520184.1 dihydrofolate reductase [Paludibacteraceae bacterium]
MKKLFLIAMTAVLFASCGKKQETTNLYTPDPEGFDYVVDAFADMQIMRYRVTGIETLSLKQQELLYYLSEAALCGRDIIWDQNGKDHLQIRRVLEAVYTSDVDKTTDDFKAFEIYLKRAWVSNGIHHHYSGAKFVPEFSQPWFEEAFGAIAPEVLPLKEGQSAAELLAMMNAYIFDPTVAPLHKNQAAGVDLLETSSSNYYEGVSQKEAEDFYNAMKDPNDAEPIMFGMNSKLVKGEDGVLYEDTYKIGGLYSDAMEKIVYWLEKALTVTETEAQHAALEKMIEFYRTGDLKDFDEYAKLWVKDTESLIDYVCCYTESYGDPLGYKSSWEALINFKSVEATERTKKISDNAQWFEDNSPIDPQFKKEEVKGVSAKVIIAAMCGGDCYPTPPLGINLPNSNWIRAVHGSKSVTIDNVSEGRAASTKGSGFTEEFTWGAEEVELLNKYKLMTDNLHTDLHECLGHGSGKLAPGVDPDALGAYGAVIEETRADLFGLYYVADQKMVDLGILPNMDAYKAQYYSYIQNGLMTQTTRIKLGDNIEQTHMRNRQLISKWVIEKGNGVVELKQRDGKYFVVVNDYEALRGLFGDLLREIQRIKSTGDFEAAKEMVEKYAITIEPELHAQILARYEALNLYPYNGFVNPVYTASFDENGAFTGLSIDYTEGYAEQHLRYSRDYSFLK